VSSTSLIPMAHLLRVSDATQLSLFTYIDIDHYHLNMNVMLIVLGKLFSEDLGLQQQFFAPQDENRDEVSDKDLATCLDFFAPKKAAKKKVRHITPLHVIILSS
jgi:hypothetical protein